MLTRRALLLGAAGALGVGAASAGAAVVLDDDLPGNIPVRRALGLVGQDGAVPRVPPVTTTVHRVHSAARGRDVDLITMVPADHAPERLPVCLILHGRGNSARGMVRLGFPEFLTSLIRARGRPFALVAVDGGGPYWIPRTPADDPQAMIRDEIPGWLSGYGLSRDGGVPAALLGISMGGFGALVQARARAGAGGPGAGAPRPTIGAASTVLPTTGAPVPAAPVPGAAVPVASGAAVTGSPGVPVVAVLSPAVFRSWEAARAVRAFASQAAWATAEPLRHPFPLPRLGVWCGREDPFYPGARQLIITERARVAHLDDGAHTEGYWRRVLPDALRFVATNLPAVAH